MGFHTGSDISCILWFPQNPAMAAALSVACFAALDQMAGTVTTKSIGVDRTTVGPSCFSRMLMKCVWRHDRYILVSSCGDSPSLPGFSGSSSFLRNHMSLDLAPRSNATYSLKYLLRLADSGIMNPHCHPEATLRSSVGTLGLLLTELTEGQLDTTC